MKIDLSLKRNKRFSFSVFNKTIMEQFKKLFSEKGGGWSVF